MRHTTLNLLYPPFRSKLLAGLAEARKAEIPLQLFETIRTRERQSILYAQGRTAPGRIITRARAGRSYHQYGLAADLVMWIDGKWSWAETDLYRKAGPIFERYGLTWLGRTSRDLVHYQLKIDLSLNDLEAIYKKSGFEGVWLELDKRGF